MGVEEVERTETIGGQEDWNTHDASVSRFSNAQQCIAD